MQSWKVGPPEINLDMLSKEQIDILEVKFKKWLAKEIKSVEFIKMLGLKKITFYKVMKVYSKLVVK